MFWLIQEQYCYWNHNMVQTNMYWLETNINYSNYFLILIFHAHCNCSGGNAVLGPNQIIGLFWCNTVYKVKIMSQVGLSQEVKEINDRLQSLLVGHIFGGYIFSNKFITPLTLTHYIFTNKNGISSISKWKMHSVHPCKFWRKV